MKGLAVTKLKLYDKYGQRKLMARLHPRRQLERYHECRGVHFESEQCADEYQYQHWVSRRQELQAPPEVGFTSFWLQEWWSITVATSVHDDLPFALSQPECAIGRAVAKYDSLGRILRVRGFSSSAIPGSILWIS